MAHGHCNMCGDELEDQAVAAICGHQYCITHAKELLNSDEPNCPQCQGAVTKSMIKVLKLGAPNDGDKARGLSLCGLPAKEIARQSWIAFNHCIEQAKFEVQLTAHKEKEANAVELEQWRAKAIELQAACEKLQESNKRLKTEKLDAKAEGEEILVKYQEKHRQKKKLEQLYAEIKAENDRLRHQVVYGPGAGIGAGGMGNNGDMGGPSAAGGMHLQSGGGGAGIQLRAGPPQGLLSYPSGNEQYSFTRQTTFVPLNGQQMTPNFGPAMGPGQLRGPFPSILPSTQRMCMTPQAQMGALNWPLGSTPGSFQRQAFTPNSLGARGGLGARSGGRGGAPSIGTLH